ncbi:ATPase AAA [Planctomycetota bacterium]|nr:ATPase AAA [Planctomycetota bacterium]
MDLAAFVAHHVQLLQQERLAEVKETQRLFAHRSDAELEARGVMLRKLVVHDMEPGLGGRVHAVLQSNRAGPLPAHRFGPGDVVGLSAQADGAKATPMVTGIIARVQREQITVALDDEDAELPSMIRLSRLSSDVTQKRHVQALQGLRREKLGAPQRLVDVCFGVRDPESSLCPTDEEFVPLDQTLDRSQRAAVCAALRATNLALIHGPPGTGKTTAVVEVIRQSVALGMHVLACAPSNVAVDNLAERLVASGLRIVRLGQPMRVLPAVVEHTLAAQVANAPEQKLLRDVRRELQVLNQRLLRADRSERAELRAGLRRLRNEQRDLESAIVQGLLDTADVVLATTTGAGDYTLGNRVFEVVIVDEAAQAIEAATWIPLLRAHKAVLAGDHCQLPPFVQSEEAALCGLATSLFERLVHGPHGPTMSRMLTMQYRMHERIQSYSSATFYNNALTPADSVRGHLLAMLPLVTTSADTTAPLVFIDTAGCGHEESAGGEDGSKHNEGEVQVVVRHVTSLLEAGVLATAIALVTPYNAQVQALRNALGDHEGLEIGTIDGVQGREKEAVIISLVRSNEQGQVGFLSELRRLNVALTRARRHLCVIGDSATLSCHPDLARLVEHLQLHGEHRSAWPE